MLPMDPASGLHDRRCRRRRVSGENAPWGLLSQELLAAVGRRMWPGGSQRRRPKASNNSRGLGPAPPSPPTPTGVGGVAPDGSRLGLHDRRCRRRRGVSGENAPWGLLSQRLLAAVGRRIVWPRRVRRRRPKASNNSRGLGPAPPSPPTPTGVGGVTPDGSRLGLHDRRCRRRRESLERMPLGGFSARDSSRR